MKYRIVTNGSWYEIEYKPRFWPFWFRRTPNRRRLDVDWSHYKFTSLKEATQYIQHLREEDTTHKWEAVIEEPVLDATGNVITKGIQEGNTRTNTKKPPLYPAMQPKGQSPYNKSKE